MSEQELNARKQAAVEQATPIVREVLLNIIGRAIKDELFIEADAEIHAKLAAVGLVVSYSAFQRQPRSTDAVYHLELFIPNEEPLFMDFGIQQESFA